ncbi:unnamed protein product [Symbiodinium sp. CCMP2592]|nr:unnamed protein product [Symbiodinium sp. CCMP2592]
MRKICVSGAANGLDGQWFQPAVFEEALRLGSEKDANAALWLAGRLPELEDEAWGTGRVALLALLPLPLLMTIVVMTIIGHGKGAFASLSEVTLQLSLRRRWDHHCLQEALLKAQRLLEPAAAAAGELEELGTEFMEALDLAEFHAPRAQRSAAGEIDALLGALGPGLRATAEKKLATGEVHKVEALLATVGSARLGSLQLSEVQQEVQRLRAMELLEAVLSADFLLVGSLEQRRRKVRHAVMTVKTALASDVAGRTARSVKALMTKELPKSFSSVDAASWTLHVLLALQLPGAEEEVGPTVASCFRSADVAQTAKILRETALLGDAAALPDWVLPEELLARRQRLREALSAGDDEKLHGACQSLVEMGGWQLTLQSP